MQEAWKNLKNDIRANSQTKLNYYSMVYVPLTNDSTPCQDHSGHFDIFTCIEKAKSFTSSPLRPYMLGDLLDEVRSKSEIRYLKVNSYRENEAILCEEVIVSPLFDELTKKLMLTSPEDALALLALNPIDQERMGMELVFYSITNRNTPENENRADYLQEKIKELSFLAPRTPIKRGATSLLVVILNLENIMEEMAFIRNYKTFDQHSNVIFVTHDLKIRTGDLEEIEYSRGHVDDILMPIINWQKSYQKYAEVTFS